MKRFVITEEEKKSIMGMYLLEQQPTGTTVSQSGGTVNRQMNRPPCIGGGLTSLGCWLDEIDKVQREIGNPKTWTMDSYNRLQKTLYDYKNWRETTPEGQAVQDSHNQKDEYVVQLPDHLKTVNESVGTKSFIRLTESDLTRLIKRIVKENNKMLKTMTFSPGDTVLIKLRSTGQGVGTLNPLTSIIVKITNSEFNEPGNVTYYLTVTKVNGTTKIKSGDMGHIEVWDDGGYSLWIDRLGKTVQEGEHSDLIKK